MIARKIKILGVFKAILVPTKIKKFKSQVKD